MILRAREHKFVFGKKTLIMGIINLTPDSFSKDGIYLNPSRVLEEAEAFETEGADILDLGGESTRPGALPIEEEEELTRILPALEQIMGKVKIPISVDTTKAKVAKECLDRGASIINDISALERDPSLAQVVREYQAGIVLMHMRGTPQDMQQRIHYKNLVEEVIKELKESIDKALESGIEYEQIVIDPGIGFAKNKEQNLILIKHLAKLKQFGRPILIGPSRKSFLGEILGKGVGDRIFGTAASVAWSIIQGADIVRVHDVEEMKDVTKVTEAILYS